MYSWLFGALGTLIAAIAAVWYRSEATSARAERDSARRDLADANQSLSDLRDQTLRMGKQIEQMRSYAQALEAQLVKYSDPAAIRDQFRSLFPPAAPTAKIIDLVPRDPAAK